MEVNFACFSNDVQVPERYFSNLEFKLKNRGYYVRTQVMRKGVSTVENDRIALINLLNCGQVVSLVCYESSKEFACLIIDIKYLKKFDSAVTLVSFMDSEKMEDINKFYTNLIDMTRSNKILFADRHIDIDAINDEHGFDDKIFYTKGLIIKGDGEVPLLGREYLVKREDINLGEYNYSIFDFAQNL